MSIREISYMYAAVVIGFCTDLQGEGFFLTSLKVILEFWD